MPFEIHKEPLYRRYYANNGSAACCYALVYGILVVLLPLIIAYNSSSFWLKENITYEQPQVSYKYNTMVQLQGDSRSPHTDAKDHQLSLFYSTLPSINNLYSEHVRYPLLQSNEVDSNLDGRVDRLEVNIQMPIQSYENIYDIQCLVFHDVQFNGKTKMVMDTVSHFAYTSAIPIGQVTIDGELELRQSYPLGAKGGYRVPYEQNPLIPSEISPLFTTANDVSMRSILQRSAARNFSTTVKQNYAYAENAMGAAVNFVNISLVLRIPTQAIVYTPVTSEVLKFAWIQYIAFFIITSFLLHRMTSFVFRNQLIHSYCSVDVMSNKSD